MTLPRRSGDRLPDRDEVAVRQATFPHTRAGSRSVAPTYSTTCGGANHDDGPGAARSAVLLEIFGNQRERHIVDASPVDLDVRAEHAFSVEAAAFGDSLRMVVRGFC